MRRELVLLIYCSCSLPSSCRRRVTTANGNKLMMRQKQVHICYIGICYLGILVIDFISIHEENISVIRGIWTIDYDRPPFWSTYLGTPVSSTPHHPSLKCSTQITLTSPITSREEQSKHTFWKQGPLTLTQLLTQCRIFY